MRLKTDWILFLTVVWMVGLGILMVYSATSTVAPVRYGVGSHYFVVRQVLYALVGFVLLFALARRDYRRLRSPLYVFAAVAAAVLLTGAAYFLDPAKHRWIPLGLFGFQPSELTKPALALFLAYLVTMRLRALNDWHTLASAALVTGATTLVVIKSDLGTVFVLAGVVIVVLAVAGVKLRYFVLAFLLVGPLLVYMVISEPYRLRRVVGHSELVKKVLSLTEAGRALCREVELTAAPVDTRYQGNQSEIAIGSGGVLGLGLMQGVQKQMYVPEAHTDFIFAVIGEELGLWGCTAVLGSYLLILWRGMRLFWLAPDTFGRYLALGITAYIVIQAMLNITVAMNLTPTKGITLPLLSYGGSSLIITMASLGLVMSVSERTG